MRVTKKIVAYYRVSTKKQGYSGLGIDAQKKAVALHISTHGGLLVGEFTEVETGTGKRHRPQLAKAISQVRLCKGTLLIAKIDRLARNLFFVETLRDKKVNFVACDMPQANTMQIQVMAMMAEHESVMISQRTKDSLAVAKANGTALGSSRPGHWKGREHLRGYKQGSKVAAVQRTKNALQCYEFLINPIREMRRIGEPLHKIAKWLNDEGHTTTRGNQFVPSTVLRVIQLFEREIEAAK